MPVDGLDGGARLLCATATIAVHLAILGSMALLSRADTLPLSENTVQLALVAEQESEQAETVEPSVAEDQNADTADSIEQLVAESQPVTEAVQANDVAAESVPTQAAPQPPQDSQQVADIPPQDIAVTEPAPEPQAAPEVVTPAPRPVAIVPVQKKPVAVQKPARPPAPPVSRAAVAGKSQQGSHSAGGAANAARYRAIVQAGLAGRKSALGGRGFNGTVAIRFTIGASGGVVSASIARSSGDRSLDSAARQLVASANFPPPPDGSFSAVVPFQVN